MTESDRVFALAVAPGKVTYPPGIGTKRFARDMAWLALMNPATVLTPKQARYLRQVVVRFWRQVPADVVALARRELAGEQGDQARQGEGGG